MTTDQLEGAARELVAATDLMRRGFEVFRTVCNNSTFDLAVYKDGSFLRIEVKGFGARSGKRPRTSPVSSTDEGHGSIDCRKFDVLAAVDGNNVRYLRSVLHTFNAASKELVGEEVVSPMTTKKNLARRSAMQQSATIQ